MQARIFKPSQTAMQSGKAKANKWVLEFEHDGSRYIENLMGWVASKDSLQQVKLFFNTKAAALNYAAKYLDINIEIIEPNTEALIIKSYAENFQETAS